MDGEEDSEYTSIGLKNEQKETLDRVRNYKRRTEDGKLDATHGEIIMDLIREAGYREFLPEAQV